MKNFLMAIFAATVLMTGCGENSQATSAEIEESTSVKQSVTIQINGKNFSATLNDNPTARAFIERLPLEADMLELNGNEKYFYLDADLPTDSERVNRIHAGDVMLFGANCLVIFYRDFATSYSYTRLGKLDNPADLEKIFGNGNVRVTFAK